MYKLLALTVLLGVVVAAEQRQKRTFSTSKDVVITEYPSYELITQQPYVSAILDLISPLIGYKASALSIAVSCIEWVASNFVVITFGALSAFGFCKFTGKCSLNFEQYLPVNQIQGFVTPENLDTAQQLFVTAVEKYAEKRKRSL